MATVTVTESETDNPVSNLTPTDQSNQVSNSTTTDQSNQVSNLAPAGTSTDQPSQVPPRPVSSASSQNAGSAASFSQSHCLKNHPSNPGESLTQERDVHPVDNNGGGALTAN